MAECAEPVLPPPTPLPAVEVGPPPVVVPWPPPPPYRVSRYAVWQNYGVSPSGRILPRVIDGPFGAYYYADGKPFPAVLLHMKDYMPYASD
jgi:hypothetical protein